MSVDLSSLMKRLSPRTLAVATFISILGHPFVLIPLTITITLLGHLSPARTLAIVTIFMASTILPLLFVIRRKVASGSWTDKDVSDHSQRRHLYAVTIPIITFSILIFWALGLPHALVIGTIGSLFLLLAGMAINHWSKISMHIMFGAYCAMALVVTRPIPSLALFLMVGAVGWSRVLLKRHTVIQVISGLFLGGGVGVLLILLT